MTKKKSDLGGELFQEREFDWTKFNAYLELGATKKLCSHLMHVSEDTIERRVRSEYDLTFTEYRNEKMAITGLKLQQKCIMMGLEGKVIPLLFALKNISGWADKIDNTHRLDDDIKKTIQLAYAIPEKQVRDVDNES